MGLLIRKLKPSDIDAAAELCGQCVGRNLYSRAFLANILKRRSHYFYLLTAPGEEAAGYIYFFLSNMDEISALYGIPRERLTAVSPKADAVIGVLQSIGIAERWRGQKLSARLMDFYLEYLQAEEPVGAAFGVFWKPEGRVPMEKNLKRTGFCHLEDVPRFWYDVAELICPYCKGRCICDAAIYYKTLNEETNQ